LCSLLHPQSQRWEYAPVPFQKVKKKKGLQPKKNKAEKFCGEIFFGKHQKSSFFLTP
jgi:hypothetical protein